MLSDSNSKSYLANGYMHFLAMLDDRNGVIDGGKYISFITSSFAGIYGSSQIKIPFLYTYGSDSSNYGFIQYNDHNDLAVRPMITLKGTTPVGTTGNGTQTKPYVIN